MVSAPPDNLALRLPADAYYHLVRTLCLALPPPLTDNPDDLARRNHAAIAAVAALVPANAAEAILAALFVAASEQCKDCLRLAQLPETPPALKCSAQALSMMRQAQSTLRLLLKLQEVRGKREANSATCNSAAWTEHCAIGLMGEALAPAATPAAPARCEPAPAKAGDTGIAEPAEPAAPPPAWQPQPAPAPIAEPEPEPDPLAEAEQYATLYPERAALIRRVGRVPHDVSFGPPDDDLVHTLVTARTPTLAALDREFAQACPMPRHGARAA